MFVAPDHRGDPFERGDIVRLSCAEIDERHAVHVAAQVQVAAVVDGHGEVVVTVPAHAGRQVDQLPRVRIEPAGSDRHSALRRPFINGWLNLAILWELILLCCVVYLPFLHEAFGTFNLPMEDWVRLILLTFTITPVLEAAKWMVRRGWFGEVH